MYCLINAYPSPQRNEHYHHLAIKLAFFIMETLGVLAALVESFREIAEVGALVLVNQALQALFFSSAVTNLISFVVRLIGFAYADTVANSRIIQLFGMFLMWYLHIWDYYSGLLYIISVFSMTIVSIYVYDFCGNVSERFDNWRLNNRDWAVGFSFFFMFLSTAYVTYSIFKKTENALQYQYVGIYLLMLFLILVGNLLRRRSVLYTLLGILTMNYLIASRYLISARVEGSNIAKAGIPFATIPYLMMALHAERRERQVTKSQLIGHLFMACISLASYSLLNDNNFPLEIVLGGVFIFGIIINR